MPKVLDVASYILSICGPMTAMKLQKLVYYSQAWHLVWDSELLFEDSIEAWAYGPIVPRLYEAHRGAFKVSELDGGNPDLLSESEKETIDRVCEYYGKYNAQQLSDLTHSEEPWNKARRGLDPLARSNNAIRPEWMDAYYSSLVKATA